MCLEVDDTFLSSDLEIVEFFPWTGHGSSSKKSDDDVSDREILPGTWQGLRSNPSAGVVDFVEVPAVEASQAEQHHQDGGQDEAQDGEGEKERRDELLHDVLDSSHAASDLYPGVDGLAEVRLKGPVSVFPAVGVLGDAAGVWVGSVEVRFPVLDKRLETGDWSNPLTWYPLVPMAPQHWYLSCRLSHNSITTSDLAALPSSLLTFTLFSWSLMSALTMKEKTIETTTTVRVRAVRPLSPK